MAKSITLCLLWINGCLWGAVSLCSAYLISHSDQSSIPAALLTRTDIVLPNNSSPLDVCHNPQFIRDASKCLNSIIESKTDQRGIIRIRISPGIYQLKGSIFFFNRHNIHIVGINNGVVLQWSQNANDSRFGQTDQFFTLTMVNVSGITIKNLTLDGNNLAAGRAIGICSITNHTSQAIFLEHLTFRNYASYNTLVGRIWGDDVFVKQRFSKRPGVARLSRYIVDNPSQASCSGQVRQLSFAFNEVFMRDVGFYLVPFTQKQTKTASVNISNWTSIQDRVVKAFQDFAVHNNHFIATIEGAGSVGDPGIHSAVKVQGASNLRITHNVFDADGFRRVFGAGGAINIGSNLTNVLISDNTILFPSNHRYPARGITLHNAFSVHKWFGIGQQNIAAPSRNIKILANNFVNSGMILSAYCICNKDLCLKEYCYEYNDKHKDNIIIYSNKYSKGIVDNRLIVKYMCEINKKNKEWLSKIFCRNNINIDFKENK